VFIFVGSDLHHQQQSFISSIEHHHKQTQIHRYFLLFQQKQITKIITNSYFLHMNPVHFHFYFHVLRFSLFYFHSAAQSSTSSLFSNTHHVQKISPSTSSQPHTAAVKSSVHHHFNFSLPQLPHLPLRFKSRSWTAYVPRRSSSGHRLANHLLRFLCHRR